MKLAWRISASAPISGDVQEVPLNATRTALRRSMARVMVADRNAQVSTGQPQAPAGNRRAGGCREPGVDHRRDR
jgi:hypothetical protein